MSAQQQNDWQTLEQSAMQLLSHPESLIDNKEINLLLRLWQYPSFERHKVWAVYVEQNEEANYSIQRVIWNGRSDHKRLFAPLIGLKQDFHANPSVTSKIKSVKTDIIKPYIEELHKIKVIPFVAQNDFGTDGIRFGFEFRKSAANANFSWWCKAPQEWETLEKWFLKTKNFLDNQFVHI
jgi:hypothetical protein